ncbi:uncharacterized protein [Typha angustifolia]|uniref:uncharacterized protein isoform X1 n=1 Tax=Typha angustifolia TaxID=59011 RepID=UPI003C2CF8A5
MQRVERTPRSMPYVSSSELCITITRGSLAKLHCYSHGDGGAYLYRHQRPLGFNDTYRMMLLRAPGIGSIVQVKPRVVNRLCPVSRRANPTFCCVPTPGDREGMEETTPEYDSRKASRDVMSDSYGEGYATRSDEEGFGGIYGGNDPIANPGHSVKHPGHDNSQGSEVKEKEKARNLQEGAAATKAPTEREAATD